MRDAAGARPRGPRGPRERECEPHGSGRARLGRQADEPRRDRRTDDQVRLPRDGRGLALFVPLAVSRYTVQLLDVGRQVEGPFATLGRLAAFERGGLALRALFGLRLLFHGPRVPARAE